VVDLGIATLAVHQETDVALQMFLIDAQAYAMTGMLSTFTQALVGRVRPFVDHCADDPDYDDECGDPINRNQGFISGHTAMAFTGAGLVCTHHAHLDLYGGGTPDVLACATSMVGAMLVGGSRIVADRHFATDVLSGFAVGFTSGYLLPELLHYRWGLKPTIGDTSISLLPYGGPDAAGLSLMAVQ